MPSGEQAAEPHARIEAQPDEIPVSEPVATIPDELLSLRGSVVDGRGNPVPGAWVEARRAGAAQSMGATQTGETGTFRLNLPAGGYELDFVLEGFTRKTMPVVLQPGQALILMIDLGGPVPIRDLEGIAPDVVETTFGGSADLHRWLNQQSGSGKLVTAVVPIRPETSLFLLKPGTGASYTVVIVESPLSRVSLLEQAGLYPSQTLLGIHLLEGRYLLVFRNE